MSVASQPRPYSIAEEWMNSLSHGIGLIVSIVGLVFLLINSDSNTAITASAIYGASLILMFLTSTIYHAVSQQRLKGVLKLFDHSAIYLLIAGTNTPFLLVSIGGWLGGIATGIIWSLALFGVTFKWIVKSRYPKISVATYLIMGWFAVLLIYPLYQALPGAGLWLLVTGGLCFSIGVAFYVAKQTKYTHAIWHLFVIAGCSCHYFAIYYYVI